MSGRPRTLPTLTAVLTLSATVLAADVPGSKDHPLIKRYEGSKILAYSSKAFDEYVLPLGPSTGGATNARLPKSARLEGSVTRITYAAPVGRSTLEIVRNYESELKNAGYAVVFEGVGPALEGGEFPGNFAIAAGYREITVGTPSNSWSVQNLVSKDERFLAAKLSRPEGDVHVVLFATAMPDHLAQFVYVDSGKAAEKGQVLFQLDVIEAKAMDTKMVTVSASDMAAGMAASGSIALYGILFDTGSAEVKAESMPTLQEIAKLLKSQAALKLLVVGHTDNVGTFEANQDLSQRRATSVVKMLVTKLGADQARLTAVGVSFASPLASNKTEAGKAKNRRVQLVER